ncbi:MAG: hypothetical protein ABR552_10265, partial [Actinomycetota bacterium]
MDREIELTGSSNKIDDGASGDPSAAIAELRRAVDELTVVARDTQMRIAGLREGVDRQLQPLETVRTQIVDGLVGNARAIGEIGKKTESDLARAVAKINDHMNARMAASADTFAAAAVQAVQDAIGRLEGSRGEAGSSEEVRAALDAYGARIEALQQEQSRLFIGLQEISARTEAAVQQVHAEAQTAMSRNNTEREAAFADARTSTEAVIEQQRASLETALTSVLERHRSAVEEAVRSAVASIEPPNPAPAPDVAGVLRPILDEHAKRLTAAVEATGPAAKPPPAVDLAPVTRAIEELKKDLSSRPTATPAPAPTLDLGPLRATLEELKAAVAARPKEAPAPSTSPPPHAPGARALDESIGAATKTLSAEIAKVAERLSAMSTELIQT